MVQICLSSISVNYFMNIETVREILKKACDAEGSQRAWATYYELSPAFVSEVINGGRKPSQNILDILGLEKVTSYRRKNGVQIP